MKKFALILSLVGMVAYGEAPSATGKAAEFPAPKSTIFHNQNGTCTQVTKGIDSAEEHDVPCAKPKKSVTRGLPRGARIVPNDNNLLNACHVGEFVNPYDRGGITYCLPTPKSVKKKHFPISYATGGGGDAVSDGETGQEQHFVESPTRYAYPQDLLQWKGGSTKPDDEIGQPSTGFICSTMWDTDPNHPVDQLVISCVKSVEKAK